MRIMPFMKRKKGLQFAGIGLDAGGGGGGSYVLPTATADRLGGVKIGNGLEVEEDGTLSTSGGGSDLTVTSTPLKIGSYFGEDLYIVGLSGTFNGSTYPIGNIGAFSKIISVTGAVGESKPQIAVPNLLVTSPGGGVVMQSLPSGITSGVFSIIVLFTKEV